LRRSQPLCWLLLEELGDAVVHSLETLGWQRPQQLSNTAWAFAKTGVIHPGVFGAISKALLGMESSSPARKIEKGSTSGVPSLNSFKPQELSNLAWAFVKVKSLSNADEARVEEYNSLRMRRKQGASTGGPDADEESDGEEDMFGTRQVLNEIVKESLVQLRVAAIPEGGKQFRSQEVCNILWAITTEEEVLRHQDFFEGVALSILSSKIRIREFKNQELSNLCWAYGSLLSDPRRDFLPADLRNQCFALLELVASHLLARYKVNQSLFTQFKSHERIQLGMSFIAKLMLECPTQTLQLIPSRERLLHALLDTGRASIAELDAVEALVMQRILMQFGMEQDRLYASLQIYRERSQPPLEHVLLENNDIDTWDGYLPVEDRKFDAVEEYAILEAEEDVRSLRRDFVENEIVWE